MFSEYIMLPTPHTDTKPEDNSKNTYSYPMVRTPTAVKIYDQNEECKRLIKELNEMVAKWK